MRSSVFLLSLYITVVPSLQQEHGRNSLHIADIASERLDSLQGNVHITHQRKRRAVEPQTQPESEAPLIEKSSPIPNNTYKIVCYYVNYARYRKGGGRYTPRDIDPQLCTHIVYGFAILDPDQLFIKPSDKWGDIENGFYAKVTDLKRSGVKVSIAMGGWTDSAGDKYSRLVNSPTSRRRFIENLLQFIYQHSFDGLELVWEFPKCWQLNCEAGPDSDKDAFAALVRELRRAFKPLGLLLSVSVPPGKQAIDAGYNVPVMSENLDWITVKTLDYHGHWDKKTGHSTPLYADPDDDDYNFSVNFTIQYWISKGADSRKLVMAFPMYGNTFTLNSNDDNSLYAYSKGPGERGEQSNSPGILTYYEICDRIRSRQWDVVRDPEGRIGPYARQNDQWVAFDDPAMVQRKAEYVINNNLGGAMVFTLDSDDFRNNCGSGKYPLLRTINTVLRESADPGLENTLNSTAQQTTEKDTTEEHTTDKQKIDQQTTGEQTTTTTTAAPQPQSGASKVVCYFTSWSWYRQGVGKYLPQNIDTSLCTHIVYAFASLDPQSLTVKPKDKWADLDNDFYRQVTQLREKGVKVLLSLGGWSDSQDDKYSRLVNDPAARGRFVPHLSEFLRRYNFDGLNLDWEYPTCWHLDCTTGPATDKEAFAALVVELSQELKPRGILISATGSRDKLIVEKAFNVKTLAEHLDWIELKTLDYRGHWDKRTGHGAPLYYNKGDITPYMNVNSSVNYWLSTGVPKEKLVLGLPFYGSTFTLENSSVVTLGATTTGPGNPGPYTASPGTMAFYEICEMVRGEGWKVEKSSAGTVAYRDNQWISYDDVSSVNRKTQFIKDLGLGGAMIWTLDFDDFNNNCGCGNYPLLRAVNHGLLGSVVSGSQQAEATTNNCTQPPSP